MCDLIDMEYDVKSGSYISKSKCEVMGDILVLDNTDSKDNEIIGLLREKAKKHLQLLLIHMVIFMMTYIMIVVVILMKMDFGIPLLMKKTR